jgi:hypothetical protein
LIPCPGVISPDQIVSAVRLYLQAKGLAFKEQPSGNNHIPVGFTVSETQARQPPFSLFDFFALAVHFSSSQGLTSGPVKM